jgi:hypothetical protein
VHPIEIHRGPHLEQSVPPRTPACHPPSMSTCTPQGGEHKRGQSFLSSFNFRSLDTANGLSTIQTCE